MFSHILVGARDLDEARQFYDAIFGAIGVGPGVSPEDYRIFWMTQTGVFGATIPINGEPATHGNGGTIGFAIDSPELVDAWHAAGVANGGTTCEDPPGVREGGANGRMYLAYLRDPSGNKLCGLCRLPN